VKVALEDDGSHVTEGDDAVEDTARYLEVPLQEFSELKLENIKQAWVGIHPRCGEPFAPGPEMTPTILGPAFAGAGEEQTRRQRERRSLS
jgi:hypothetical protein